MRQSWTVIKAFWLRDVTVAMSYRLNFLFQLCSFFFSALVLYFLSKLVGNQALVARFGGFLQYAIIGLALTGYFTTGFSSFANVVQREQSMGTLEYVMMTPAKLPIIILASSAWEFFWTTLNAVVMLGTGCLLFGVHLKGNPLLALAVLFLTTVSFSCLGILSASFIMVFKRGDPLKFIINITTYILGGVTFPIALFPGWMQKISNLLPVTHGLSALREILLLGKTFIDVWPQLTVLLVFAAVGLPVSLLVFIRAVNIARREGTLLHS